LELKMPKKRNVSASKTAEKLAALASRHLSQYSEDEQKERISRAEKRVANAARAGSPRTSSLTPRTRKSSVSVRGR